MSPEETERLMQLCARIKTEKEPKKLTVLIKELNQLLEHKEKPLPPDSKAS